MLEHRPIINNMIGIFQKENDLFHQGEQEMLEIPNQHYLQLVPPIPIWDLYLILHHPMNGNVLHHPEERITEDHPPTIVRLHHPAAIEIHHRVQLSLQMIMEHMILHMPLLTLHLLSINMMI